MVTKNKKSKPADYWRRKLANDQTKDGRLPRVVKITGKLSRRWGTGTVAIPAPRDVDRLMKKVPSGRVTTINEIRSKVAKDNRATMGCPITCGIFSWIAANAAGEAARVGDKKTTPYWRTLKQGGEINPKYPGGVPGQKKKLKTEGHRIISRGKKTIVADWEQTLKKFV